MNKNLTPIFAAIAAAAIIALVIVLATGGDDDDDDVQRVAAPVTQTQTQAPPATDPDDDGGAAAPNTSTTTATVSTADGLRALRTAEDEAGTAALDIDQEDGGAGWTVAFPDGTELRVAADGRQVDQRLTDDVDVEDQQALEAAQVGLADAIRTAENEAGGAALDSADIEGNAWSLTFVDGVTETEVLVDATNGDVLNVTQEQDD